MQEEQVVARCKIGTIWKVVKKCQVVNENYAGTVIVDKNDTLDCYFDSALVQDIHVRSLLITMWENKSSPYCRWWSKNARPLHILSSLCWLVSIFNIHLAHNFWYPTFSVRILYIEVHSTCKNLSAICSKISSVWILDLTFRFSYAHLCDNFLKSRHSLL